MTKYSPEVILILRRIRVESRLTGDWLVTRPDWAGMVSGGWGGAGGPPASQSVLSYDGLQSQSPALV